MRVPRCKHLLASALIACFLLLLAPAAMADPASSQTSASSTTAAVQGAPVDPSPSATSDQNAPPPEQVEPSDAPPSAADGSAATAPPVPSGASQTPAVPTAPASSGSSSTIQTIVQVQSLGCSAHCVGSKQSQTAQQTSVTIQPAAPSEPVDPTTDGSQHQTQLVQLQLGCIAHCFGSTTVAGGAHGGLGAVQQLLGSSNPPGLRTQRPGPNEQSVVVHQSSFQVEDGGGVVSFQSQIATQVSASVQDAGTELGWVLAQVGTLFGPGAPPVPSDPSPARATSGSAASPQSPAEQAINQVEQDIWQLQIGCLVFCSQTAQSQQAEQSMATIGVIPNAPGAAPLPLPTTQSYQLVWQLQVGCLFWCYDAVETQTATMVDSVVSVPAPNPSPGPGVPSGPGAPPPAPQEPAGPDEGSGLASSPPGAAPALTSAPPGPPMISSTAPGLIRAAPGAVSGTEITRPAWPRPKGSGRLTPRAEPLPASPSALLAARGPSLSAIPTPNIGAARRSVLPAAAATPTSSLSSGERLRPRHRAVTKSEAMPAQVPVPPGGSSWELIVLFVIVGLSATALEISGVRERWALRLKGWARLNR